MDCWPQIRALEGKSLQTLDRRKPFEVMAAAESQVALKVSTGKIRTVRRKEIESAFRELTLRGEISRSEIHERHSRWNPAYVAAMLAELEGVTTYPAVLSLRVGRYPGGIAGTVGGSAGVAAGCGVSGGVANR